MMPNDAARIKVAGVKNFGAEIVFYDRHAEGREELGTRVLRERGGTFVHPYDDPLVVAGQGTAGLEAAQQMRARDIVPDVALIPCGGGGLLSGVTVGLRSEFPKIDVRSVEPEVHDDMARSLAEGRHVAADEGVTTICDSLLPPRVGKIAYVIGTEYLGPGLVVSDAEVLEAIAFALLRLKLRWRRSSPAASIFVTRRRCWWCQAATPTRLCWPGRLPRLAKLGSALAENGAKRSAFNDSLKVLGREPLGRWRMGRPPA